MQALVGSHIFLANLENDPIGDAFRQMAPVAIIAKIAQQNIPELVDPHEEFLFLLDFLPNQIFELWFTDQYGKKNVSYTSTTPTINYEIGEYKYQLINTPKIIVSHFALDVLFDDYTLVSYIDHLGGHWVCNSVRGDKSYRFDDSTFQEAPMLPNEQTKIFVYELKL